MEKAVEKSFALRKGVAEKKRSSKTTKKKIASKKMDFKKYPKVSRLSYAEYVRRHALAHSILDEIED